MKLQFFDWIYRYLWFKPKKKDEPPLIIIPHEPMELWNKYKTLLDREGINTPLRKAHFFGQIKAESGLKPIRESMNYSTQALISKFGRHRISVGQAEKFGRNSQHPADQRALANILYGGTWGLRNLGNKYPEDGWNLRGRGFKQTTGRSNYEALSRHTGINYVDNPDWLLREADAMIAAIFFWNSHNLNRLADMNDVKAVTKVVNGGYNGLEKRELYTQQFLRMFSA